MASRKIQMWHLMESYLAITSKGCDLAIRGTMELEVVM